LVARVTQHFGMETRRARDRTKILRLDSESPDRARVGVPFLVGAIRQALRSFVLLSSDNGLRAIKPTLRSNSMFSAAPKQMLALLKSAGSRH
jgi:hypothetical protein